MCIKDVVWDFSCIWSEEWSSRIGGMKYFEVGHVEKMKRKECVYMSEIVGPISKARPLGRWKDRIMDCMCEWSTCVRGVLLEGEGMNKQGQSIWIGRGGGSSAVATP